MTQMHDFYLRSIFFTQIFNYFISDGLVLSINQILLRYISSLPISKLMLSICFLIRNFINISLVVIIQDDYEFGKGDKFRFTNNQIALFYWITRIIISIIALNILIIIIFERDSYSMSALIQDCIFTLDLFGLINTFLRILINPDIIYTINHNIFFILMNIQKQIGFIAIVLLTFTVFTTAQSSNPCFSPCLACSLNSSTSCISCQAGYILQNNYCVPVYCQILYCAVCSSNSTCLTCQSNYQLSNNTCICQTNFAPTILGSSSSSCSCTSSNPLLCVGCNLQGCLTCTNSTYCGACVTGYKSNSLGGCIACNITNCLSCLINNFCQLCSSNFTVSNLGQCVTCDLVNPGCLGCSAQNSCICANGYITLSVSGSNTCILCSIPNCISCSSANQCSNCGYSYVLSTNNTCTTNQTNIRNNYQCNPECSTCNSNGTCIQCIFIYSSFPNSNGSCYFCSVPFCLTCNQSNTQQCTQCVGSYYLLTNTSTCVLNPAGPYCSQNQSNGACASCMTGYALTSGICSPCASGCYGCSPSNLQVCTSCDYNQYLSNGICYNCPSYCQGCNQNTCTSFQTNVIVMNNLIYTFGCASTCIYCSNINPSICTYCAVANYLTPVGTCLPCAATSNCATCNYLNPAQCFTCMNGNSLITVNGTNVCNACQLPCIACQQNSPTICTGCTLGFSLINSSCLSPICNNNCLYCNSNKFCILCSPGYFLYNGTGTCQPGVPGCFRSYLMNPTICEACFPIGLYLDPYTNRCFNCPANCYSCSPAINCHYCNDAYYLAPLPNNTVFCAPNCIFPCATCSYSNTSQCYSCFAGYILNQSTSACASNFNCAYNCQVCPLGYAIQYNQICLACGPTCGSCRASNPNVCTGCLPSNWLNVAICSPCPLNCAVCSNGYSCSTCVVGYAQYYFGLSQDSNCQPCQSPCLTCTASPSLCLTCSPGFNLIGTQCITSFNFAFSLVVANTSTAFYNQYSLFVSQILNAVATTNQGLFFPSSALNNSGSFLFSASISNNCNTSACSSQAYNNLTTLFGMPFIAGLRIVSSTVINSSIGNNTCAPPCLTCTTPGGSICLSCAQGLVLRDSTCLSTSCSVLYCAFCSNSFTCVQCLPTFILTSNSCACQLNFTPTPPNSPNSTCLCTTNCSICTVPNCIGCTNSSICTTCANGFTLTNTGNCLACGILGCLTCSSNNFCGVCANNYSISTTGTCVLCPDQGCQSCQSNLNCEYCVAGYTLVSECSLCTISNCIACNSTNTCITCANGFNLVNNNCVAFPCLPPCKTCDFNGNCITCFSPTYSILPNNGSCFRCSVLNCFICASNNSNLCQQCSTGFKVSVNTNGSSSCVIQNSVGCGAVTSSGLCLQCNTYYVLLSNGTCIPCTTTQQACNTCSNTNPSVCTSCTTGFYISNTTCYPCPALCNTCNGTSCINPNPNAIMINNTAYIDVCSWPCLTCSPNNDNYCLVCQGGFYIQNGLCVACNYLSNCFSCNPSAPSVCFQCFNYGNLVTINSIQICNYCNSPCMTCLGSSSSCTSCIDNYVLVFNICNRLTCSQFCSVCTPSGCITCVPGYFPMNGNGVCLPGVAGCITPFAPNPSLCQSCTPGTILNPFTNICVLCPSNCQTCTLSQVCISCFSGFYLTGSNSIPCAPNCIFPCVSCSFINPSICLTCYAGYTPNPIEPTQCIAQNCGPNCVVCPIGAVLSLSQTCIVCSQGCASCNPNNSSICLSCMMNQYLANNSCITCPKGCASCINSNYCTSCDTGYVNTIISVSYPQPQIQQCTMCQSPCLTCFTLPNYCISCKTGFYLFGTQCINQFNYALNALIQGNFTNFYSNYLSFINSIVNSLNFTSFANMNLIFPNGITTIESNLQFNAIISSQCLPQSVCSQNEYNNIVSLFNTGNISNTIVISFQLTANGGSPFTSNNSTAFVCSNPCSSCSNSTGYCLTCVSGYVLLNNYCVSAGCQVLYCQSCSANNTCNQCNSNFILSNNNCICQYGWNPSPLGSPNAACLCQNNSNTQCITCKVSNCLNCTTPNICQSCASPYKLNSNNICVLCNINSCLSCNTNNNCQSCAAGLSPTPDGNRCILCNITNCLYCSAIQICSVCQPGFNFNAQQTACISCNVPNCLTCQGDNQCLNCAPGYTVDTNFTCSFQTCQYPCSTCNLDGSCATCANPYQPTVGQNNTCYCCNVANCQVCTFNSTTCTNCLNGYTLSTNGSKCTPNCILNGCQSCVPTNSQQCSSCGNGYVLVQGNCQLCAFGCAACSAANPSNCNSCVSGFYLSNNSCIVCPSYCSSCTSPNECSQLSAVGYSLVLMNGVYYLAECDQGCQQCSSTNPSQCLLCDNGFYLNQTICLACQPSSNCLTCSSQNPKQCLSCFPNSYLTIVNQTNVCSPCVLPCTSCSPTNLNLCLSCPSNYLLQNSQCLNSKCPPYCSNCNSGSNCIQCISGYVSFNGACVSCLTGCSQCSSSSPGICLTCLDGTYLSPSTQQCVGCSLNCKTCLPSGCTNCFAGYYITSALACAANCVFPCATCSQNNPSNCLSCQLGYKYDTSAFQNCQSSVNCSASFSCSACPLGYILTPLLQCQLCNSNCARCLTNLPNNCTSCVISQYLDASQCLKCPSNCANCLSLSVCLQCAFGYTGINVAAANTPLQCAACNNPCMTCQNSPNNCLSCVQSYKLINGKCISNFNYGFTITLSANSTQFYSNYNNFLNSLSSVVSSSIGAVNIISINFGSTDVNGSLSTEASPQTSGSSSQYSNLQNLLSKNSNIANMGIVSSTVLANGGNPQQSSPESKSYVIIVAIVVPLVALIAFGIGVFIYLRKKRQAALEFEQTERSIGVELHYKL